MESNFEGLTEENLCKLLKGLKDGEELVVNDNGIHIIDRGSYES